MVNATGGQADGARTLLGASALTAGVLGVVASASALARGVGAIPAPPSQHSREQHDTGTASRTDATKDRTTGAAEPRPGTVPSPDDPRKPNDLGELKKPTIFYSLRKTMREFSSDQCTDLAAALVYYSVLALGPAVVAIGSILGLLSPSTISTLSSSILKPALAASPGTYSLVNGLLANASRTPAAGIGLVIGIVGALWSASGYVGAFGRAMNRIYSIPEGRPVWKLRPVRLLVTVAIVVLVVLAALILVSTGPVVQQIAGRIGVGNVAFLVFSIVKWPVLAVIAVMAVAILYYFSPNIRQPRFKWTSAGSIFALVVWALVTVAFGLYLSFSGGGSYAKFYGPVAGVVIFLLWLWITNLALLFGAEFDAELERSRELQGGIAAEEQIQLPMRDARGSDKKAHKHEEDVAAGRRLRLSRGRRE